VVRWEELLRQIGEGRGREVYLGLRRGTTFSTHAGECVCVRRVLWLRVDDHRSPVIFRLAPGVSGLRTLLGLHAAAVPALSHPAERKTGIGFSVFRVRVLQRGDGGIAAMIPTIGTDTRDRKANE